MSRTVLVARLDSLGDVLLAGPAVRAVAARARVELLCGPRGSEAGALLPGVTRVHEWECPWISDPAGPVTADAVRDLSHLVTVVAPDEAIILTSFHQSPLPLALLLRLAGVTRITGASVDYAGALLDVRLRPGEDFPEEQAETTRALTIAAAAGYALPSGDDGRLAVVGREGVGREGVGVLTGAGPYVVVHPGAGVPARAWPTAAHAETVRRLVAAGIRVVVTGSSGERGLAARVAADLAVDLSGHTTLAQLAGVLAAADVVIAGNTGTAHLAAAVGTPVVSLFSPVVSERCWRPFGVPVVVHGRTDTACAGTRARECPIPGHPCLADVSPADVVSSALMLRRPPAEAEARRA